MHCLQNKGYLVRISVNVVPPIMSDHSLIIGKLVVDSITQTSLESVVVRSWKDFDVDAFRHDLSVSQLVTNPTTNCSDLYWCATIQRFISY